MSSVDLQLSLACGACGVVVPINAFVGEVVCWSCERHTKLDETVWKLLLEVPLQAAGQLAAGVEQAATVRSDVGTFHRVFHAGAPMCNACRAPMPASDLRDLATRAGSTGLAHCPQCNYGVYLRGAPPLLALQGVVALAGETDASRAKQPVTLACTTCGGQLQVDGFEASSLRAVTAEPANTYPDELFLSLRSLPVRQWSLLLSSAVAQQVATAKADWALLYDLIVDAQGNLYAWGLRKGNQARSKAALREALANGRVLESHGICSLWCMAPDLTLRWTREGLEFHDFQTRLALTPSGTFWFGTQKSAQVVQATDGATVYRYSGRPGEGGSLETQGAEAVAVDPDGTLLVLTDDDRLLRYTWNGEPVATWGDGPRARTKPEEVWVSSLSKKPLHISQGTIAVGWNGWLYAQSDILFEDACHVASFSRDGKRQHLTKCPIDAARALFKRRPAVDASGAVFIMVEHVFSGGGEPSVYRIDPDGKHSRQHLAPKSRGGLLGDEPMIAVMPDGTLFAAGNGSQLRRFGPDGRLQFASPAAEAAR